jgi:hypothetical protein
MMFLKFLTMLTWRKRMEDPKGDKGKGTGPGNKGQDKVYTVTNPTTGETRTVTQRQWREEKLGQQGFEKPAELPEEPEAV